MKVNDLVRHISSGWIGRVWSLTPGSEYPVYVMFNSAMGFGECYTDAEAAALFEAVEA